MDQEGLMFPKSMGTRKKTRRKRQRSIIWDNKQICYLCRRYGSTTEHHIFEGPDRAASTRNGLTIRLCFTCHRQAHDDGETERYLHRIGQQAYESQIGSRRQFMAEFRKNYLD